MDDELTPEIQELITNTSKNNASQSDEDDFENIKPSAPSDPVNLRIKKFQPVTQFFSPTHTTDIFDDTSYYKTALSDENESAKRLHTTLSKYLHCQDQKDRTIFRQQLGTTYWEFLKSLVSKMALSKVPMAKKMLMRYGVIFPSLFTPEQKETFSTAFIENTSNEPIYYLDEWFHAIGTELIPISTTDEAPTTKKSVAGSVEETTELMQLKTKNMGKLQSAENFLTMKEGERATIENDIKAYLETICDHPFETNAHPHKQSLSDSQRKLITEINEKLRLLIKNDKELANYLTEFKELKEISHSLEKKLNSTPTESLKINDKNIYTELDTIRQMAKMTVGRQGNHFPLFTREFFHCLPKETGFRENIIEIMTWIESIDTGAYCRAHKTSQNRIVPFVILIPTYGDSGFCWEPFSRYNRITSRGRIGIPMYPKNIKKALLMAIADLRWQVAKEKASYYWMEEGLTGQYYNWFMAQKVKGDIKDSFIDHYILWITKESEGTQALEKEVRSIFWRYMPFSPDIKEKVRLRSLVYQELCQRDQNRSMSDGY